MTQESWKAVAYALADRLQYMNSCDNGHKVLTEDCPCCQDMEAYQRFEKKVKQSGADTEGS